ncbi:bifunctional peptide chain release factor N(5)-glutamine methyltransferase PrmC/tRNA (guanosine(46)-N7)-methyltransferase TrmB [Rickettsia prowazekii]|uniref:Bifunctional methyltransferase n=2 Tax=Rickettsia prowazekii TaxID=782 RepID=RFTRM_RICPR|nr:bifunctional peptide chain release factor N(5)-glutamine methyltransferase PrmC/tRNA (guanosine(46)-N7)-methyltransferase TrmB [Rickettsia prowazekii]Q9ZCB3.1 RecName: Full=Bifunctional methyltransferase; Includes: RecName: Full=Release factor glutamine methyltransferase; Short=RF MTase; AltName: Full=M.RprHemKP; AltName: Full=N5-glutamine methyltransferase PrmC; AltName: Full=Protein-(glutamine-N5) MTase PrmC; AltName: Full=Protein-glutamine N-methyltransferase PrmC; Includes: RecName: Full=tR
MQYSIKQILSNANDKLNKIGINLPGLEARILLQHVTNKPIEHLLIKLNEQLSEAEIEAFEKLLERRLAHEPIAYIIGVKEFYSREFIVNKHVLIPRIDTEVLVDVVIGLVVSRNNLHMFSKLKSLDSVLTTQSYNILELGTGSGCIAISLLCELPNTNIIATDISVDAIKVAKSNSIKYNVTDRIQIIHSNWFEKLDKQKFDFIVSNPPYISHTEKLKMAIETINYEPSIALFAEEDGLEAYSIIAKNAKQFLKPNGKIILEIGFSQAAKVSKIFLNYGYNIDYIYRDLQSHNRVIEISPINLNRSYARRIGKSLSKMQQKLLDNELPKYLFSKEKFKSEKRKVFLEIGFGMGEHLINQAKINPDTLFIGVEVYLNGVANVLKHSAQHNITNFLLFPNNLDLILNDLPNNSLDGIYILFPDPWIKNKKKKKRIFNKERLKILQNKLKNNGNLVFASDIENYFYEAMALIRQNGNFEIIHNDDYLQPHDNYIITKYHQKAINANRTAKFMILQHALTDH